MIWSRFTVNEKEPEVVMDTPQNTSHIVFVAAEALLECKHCGQQYVPALPAPVDIFVAACNAFVKIHKGCKLPAIQESVLPDNENRLGYSRLISTVNNLPDFFPAAKLSPAAIQSHIFKAEENGLAGYGAIIRQGRKVLIDVEKYGAWLTNKPINMDNQDEQDKNPS